MKAVLLAVALCVVLGACATRRDVSLYQQLGGQQGIERISDELIAIIRADTQIADLFENTDWAYFRARLIEFLCVTADGPCEYQGLPMAEAHSGMDITEAEFNRFVDDARVAMTRAGTPLGAQNQLLARLAPMRADVIRH